MAISGLEGSSVGDISRLPLILATAVILSLLGVVFAQYGYYDMFGNPVYADPYGYYGYPMTYGYGADPLQQQMDALNQQIDAYLVEQLRPFVEYYRQSTGDYQTPDATAAHYGMQLWCDNFPVECQRARNTTTPEAAAWMAQSAAAHQQNMAQRQAGFDSWMQGVQSNAAAQDASYNAWMNSQNQSYEANQAWIQGVIWGEGNYTNPGTGTTMSLPFAPAQGWNYQSPAGNPLWFDANSNTWYEMGPGGSYTPYYPQ